MRRIIASLACAVLIVSGIAGPVSATHNLNTRKWDQQPYGIYTYAPRFYFNADVPSACRTRFRAGASAWNALQRDLRYLEGSGYPVYIEVKYQDLAFPNNDDLAFNELDAISNITWQKISFNNNVDFPDGSRWFPYCGTGTPASDEYDFMGVAMHELGHNQIQNHTAETANIMHCCFGGGQSKHTLTTHDKSSFQALYGPAS